MTPIAIQIASTTLRVKIPHFQTRSTFDKNFIAAATSKKPIATLTEFIHPPARGSWAIHCGTSARTKNGKANTAEKASMPTSGRCQSPCEAETSIVPTNGDVHVNDVSVNVSPISRAPITPLPSPSCVRVMRSSFVKTPVGMFISYAPNRLNAKKRNMPVISRLIHGFAAKRLIPAAPTNIASSIPTSVKVATIPSE